MSFFNHRLSMLAAICAGVMAVASGAKADSTGAKDVQSATNAQCAQNVVSLAAQSGPVSFEIELASTPDTRARGLMFREHMRRDAGMLFIYEYPQRVAFWMENTLIPLDMIFIDATGVVRNVHANAIPGDRTAIPGQGQILAVLEINGGLAEKLGITAGTRVQHPSLPQDIAIWPCQK